MVDVIEICYPLDGKIGKVLSEYWHRGHLRQLAVADLDNDGEPEVLLGGVNDAPEYKQATLVVLDQKNISGSSRDPQERPYFLVCPLDAKSMWPSSPKTPFSLREEFNIVSGLHVAPDRITVVVSEGILDTDPHAVIYDLDYNLRPITALLSDQLQEEYRNWQDSGRLPNEPPERIAERLKGQVRVI